MSGEVVKLRCQRIGCDATFTPDNNPEGSCVFHDSVNFNLHRLASIFVYYYTAFSSYISCLCNHMLLLIL